MLRLITVLVVLLVAIGAGAVAYVLATLYGPAGIAFTFGVGAFAAVFGLAAFARSVLSSPL